ncbi:MAG: hypothetical protein Tsb0021_16660 [Chlamydiales bacterium]
MTEDLFLIAGEHSGDLHGQQLMHSLTSLDFTRFHGIGGPLMRESGLTPVIPMEDLQVMGFKDLIVSLNKIRRQLSIVQKEILKHQPTGVVFIDYPGFNLRLASALRKIGYQGKLIHYISPTVWAWGKGRIQKMVSTLDMLLTILPFEKQYYTQTPLTLHYVGNPSVEEIQNHNYISDWKCQCHLNHEQPIVALFPGSRGKEIDKGIEKFLLCAKAFQEKHSHYQIAISSISKSYEPLFHEYLKKYGIRGSVVPVKYRFELMREACAAIAASGTVTLELALHHTPTVVTYEVGHFNRFIAQYILKIHLPYYSLPNILAQREVFPEFIATPPTVDGLLHHLSLLTQDSRERNKTLRDCRMIEKILGKSQASKVAANHIRELLR